LARKERKRLQNEGKDIGRIYFYQELERKLKSDEWAQYQQQIREFSTAHYQTNLPQYLDADPVYAVQHARAFEIVRGERSRKCLIERRFDFHGRLGIAAFHQGMDLLSFDDILDLLDSEEADEFAQARDEMDTSDESIDRLQRALSLYVVEIEKRIFARFPGLGQESTEGSTRRCEITFEEWIRAGNMVADFCGIFWTAVSVGSNFLNRMILDRYFEKQTRDRQRRIREEAALHMQKRDELRALFTRSKAEQAEYELIRQLSAVSLDGSASPADVDEIEVYYQE
jgi:hypothetical protein